MRRRRRTSDVSDELRAFLFDQPMPEDGNPFRWAQLRHDDSGPDRPGPLREAWTAHGDAVLAKWIVERPGSRPSTWWRFDAPEPRRKVGGKGEAHRWVKAERGIPSTWVEFDPQEPPRYESEATYLRRHDLLQDGERDRIPPSAYRPETAPTPASASKAI